jgi:hypothetical protein
MAQSKTSVSTAAVVGAAAAAAVAGAAAYWLYGAKDAPKHRKMAKSWMLKARSETLDAVEAAIAKAGTIDKETYLKIVDTILRRYKGAKNVSTAELAQVSKDLKSTWGHMQNAYKEAGKAKKGIKKAVKKATKKKR